MRGPPREMDRAKPLPCPAPSPSPDPWAPHSRQAASSRRRQQQPSKTTVSSFRSSGILDGVTVQAPTRPARAPSHVASAITAVSGLTPQAPSLNPTPRSRRRPVPASATHPCARSGAGTGHRKHCPPEMEPSCLRSTGASTDAHASPTIEAGANRRAGKSCQNADRLGTPAPAGSPPGTDTVHRSKTRRSRHPAAPSCPARRACRPRKLQGLNWKPS